MKRFCKQMAGTAGLLFILAACSNNSSSYPEEYVGFEKATKNYSFDKNKDTEEFDVKIIAAEKKNEDREVLINGINMPGKAAIFSIEDGHYPCQEEISQSTSEDLSEESDRQS